MENYLALVFKQVFVVIVQSTEVKIETVFGNLAMGLRRDGEISIDVFISLL